MSDGINDFGNECNPLTECHCDSKYSIEPHGKGWALYFGRCNHNHGFNLAHITEANPETLDFIVKVLNDTFEDKT